MNTARSLRNDLANFSRGVLMGAADIIPGISGGTVALILGIYQRLVTALSRFDREFLASLKDRQFGAAARHIDLRFLVSLGLGIGVGVGSFAKLMHYLFENQFENTFAVFFGLIVASCILVARQIETWNLLNLAGGMAGAAFAYWLCGRLPTNVDEFHLGYLFLCSFIAICAMILPGISGAFVLLIMGMYYQSTGIIKNVVSFEATARDWVCLLVMWAGCALGIVSFSKLLRWLLDHYQSLTVGVLCGFMCGSLRRIWPFKIDVTGRPDVDFKERVYENVWISDFAGNGWIPTGLILLSAVFVLGLDWFSTRQRHLSQEGEKPDGARCI